MMSDRDSHLEVLINRYLDGEISAREMEDLRTQVDSDDRAKDLFDQMQQLHRSCQDAVQTYVLQPGRPVEDLIANAWEGQRSHVWTGRVKRVVFSQFVSGLAAGLLVALAVYWVMPGFSPAGLSPAVSRNAVVSPRRPNPVTTVSAEEPSQEDGLPQVNYFYYKDSQGNDWVVEGVSVERDRTVADQRERGF
jgi:anti-sigma factor RsiW